MRGLDGKPAVLGNGFPTGVANLPVTQSAESMIADLVQQTETVARRMREVVLAAERADDVVTADLLTGFIARHEKDAWMLRATLRN